MNQPRVSIIMGSQSDWATMQAATQVLNELEIAYETRVVSAHRTPERLYQFASNAHHQGIEVIIAGAGGSAHLAGMAAAMTHLPVIAVPVASKHFNGMDSLMSMVQMPRGVAVACQAVGEAGAYNAGLMAVQMLALADRGLSERLQAWRARQTDGVPNEVE
ncbi:5-(carboxyamino)imidazole ribonucleotide mutase [Aestuariirhabdus litorea]|uniref:N5-carboxyaminoimidazole ribonucleotide mutase n=1 Tax=Aestuariirhabdus litorea TaxID=2528527 RepID=A0A3P3VVE8_9GAMM|nr:5-(carboxyamino)imidazole ribonucleotide mutase [Aestuariirhabdus litorea]RRJ84723.1 5-(carboxyamino)imidazole ribonucleotide mutase [Aestuariirhabdus litorea]RWW97948.1 5-(carboxyamino)imidazole ribonucleotide mutase [Endozoicomonadaceae bacterium GTF-13]